MLVRSIEACMLVRSVSAQQASTYVGAQQEKWQFDKAITPNVGTVDASRKLEGRAYEYKTEKCQMTGVRQEESAQRLL